MTLDAGGPDLGIDAGLDGGEIDAFDGGTLADGGGSDSATMDAGSIAVSHRIAATFATTCVVRGSGTVYCWGMNQYGNVGNGSAVPPPAGDILSPFEVSLPESVSSIAAAETHTCALGTSGAVYCWGFNSVGELGTGDTTSHYTAVTVAGLPTADSLSVGRGLTCAVVHGGAVACWGESDLFVRESALDAGMAITSPSSVPGLADVIDVRSGSFFNCALARTGSVSCWGLNVAGMLGDSTTVDSLAPTAVTALADATGLGLGANAGTTCIVAAADAGVRCWGSNALEGLGVSNGDGGVAFASDPRAVSGIAGPVVAAATGGASCVLLAGGGIQCWGPNARGQLGNGTGLDSFSPVFVSGISTAVDLAVGAIHACAILSDDSVQCWGGNDHGQLGNGDRTDQSRPVAVVF